MALIYKIVELNTRTLMKGRLRLRHVEAILNKWSADGWQLDRIMTGADYSFLSGKKEVYLIIFKREAEQAPKQEKETTAQEVEEGNGPQ